MYSMQQANSPYGRGHRGKKFCSSANVSFTFALKIFVSGVKEWYINNNSVIRFSVEDVFVEQFRYYRIVDIIYYNSFVRIISFFYI